MKKEEYYSTLLETSYDKNSNESLLWDEKKRVINYDRVASDLYKEYREGENLSSSDCLCYSGDYRLFIEFKNQRVSRIDYKSIRKKAFDSLLLFSLLSSKWKEEEKKNAYIVVYRENDIPSWSRFKSKALSYSGRICSHPILFGLERYLSLYSEIWTMDAESFFHSPLYKKIEENNSL